MNRTCRSNDAVPQPMCCRSRAYSVMKRLSLGLLFTGTVGLFEAIWFSKFGRPWKLCLELAVILQLALIPLSMIAWGVISPRSYSRHPSVWLVFAWIPLLVFGLYLSLEFTLFAAGWTIWDPPFSGCSSTAWRNSLETLLSSEKKSADLEWSEDPAVFWSNRVVWLDEEVLAVAHRHGRAYPPIPCHDPVAMKIDPSDIRVQSVQSVETVVPFLGESDRERWFWDRFQRTHPYPPDYLDKLFASEVMFSGRHLESPKKSNDPEEWNQATAHLRRLSERYKEMGIPPEMFDPDCLLAGWMLERQRRESLPDSLLSGELKTATSWRIPYLRRLRREGWDERYVEAYKKAWGIMEEKLREEE